MIHIKYSNIAIQLREAQPQRLILDLKTSFRRRMDNDLQFILDEDTDFRISVTVKVLSQSDHDKLVAFQRGLIPFRYIDPNGEEWNVILSKDTGITYSGRKISQAKLEMIGNKI